jgi:hypothetical protein
VAGNNGDEGPIRQVGLGGKIAKFTGAAARSGRLPFKAQAIVARNKAKVRRGMLVQQ